MRLSRYFIPTIREEPSEAKIISHKLMLRAGLIRQASAGIYNWLPIGLKVMKNIEKVVRKEQNLAGSIEMLMPTIQSAELWKKSDRYEGYGKEMLRIRDRNNHELLFGPTNEEQITDLIAKDIKSYKELPKIFYHIQWKFRDEVRPRFGIMRCREFLMKDAYSFDFNYESALNSYNRMYYCYLRTFKAIGLKVIPVAADTGPIGGDLSHEFIVVAETGESEIYCDSDILNIDISDAKYGDQISINKLIHKYNEKYSVSSDKFNINDFNANVEVEKQVKTRGVEVGHIFYFGSKYSSKLGAEILNSNSEKSYLEMGSYGIGISRLVGAIIEASHDDKGIIWPKKIAPFKLAIINLRQDHETCNNICESLYNDFSNSTSVIYDDRNLRSGVKLKDMDLIGIPFQIIVGPNGIAKSYFEFKNRKTYKIKKINIKDKKVIFEEIN